MSANVIIVLVLLVAAAVIPFIAVSAGFDDPNNENYEFYFTRLRYRENGMRGRGFLGMGGTMPKPAPYRCPEFGGGNFFPPQGWGWGTDYPGGDCKFMGGIHRLTGLPVYPHPNIVDIMDPELFTFPYIYIVEPGGLFFTDQEAARLREYFARGGFLHVDDFWGGWQRANFEHEIRKVFPDRPMEALSVSHEIFHTFFDINEIMQIPNRGNGCYGPPYWEQSDDKEPRIYGISDDRGRLQVLVTYNSDLGDAWEYMDLACYPQKLSGYAYRVGLNAMIYAMSH
jgi:Domain of unknown function (DUF4159)